MGWGFSQWKPVVMCWVVATQIFFIFTPIYIWGNDPISLIFFKGVETTN